jgi:hypothetical protein
VSVGYVLPRACVHVLACVIRISGTRNGGTRASGIVPVCQLLRDRCPLPTPKDDLGCAYEEARVVEQRNHETKCRALCGEHTCRPPVLQHYSLLKESRATQSDCIGSERVCERCSALVASGHVCADADAVVWTLRVYGAPGTLRCRARPPRWLRASAAACGA